MATIQEIKDIIASALEVDLSVLSDDATMGDFPEWDSMGHMEVVIALDTSYSIGVTPDSIQATMSIPEIIKYIESK